MGRILIIPPEKKPEKWILVPDYFLSKFDSIEEEFSFAIEHEISVTDLIAYIEFRLGEINRPEFMRHKYQRRPVEFAEHVLLPKLKEFQHFELVGFYPF